MSFGAIAAWGERKGEREVQHLCKPDSLNLKPQITLTVKVINVSCVVGIVNKEPTFKLGDAQLLISPPLTVVYHNYCMSTMIMNKNELGGAQLKLYQSREHIPPTCIPETYYI